MRMRTAAVSVLLVLAATGLLAAHELFLRLETYFVPADTEIRVLVLNGTFASSEAPVAADRLLDLSLAGARGRVAVPRERWQPRGDSTWLALRTGVPGTYVLGASLAPRELSLSAPDFNTYLEHDGIPDVLAERQRTGQLGRAVRERYHKHVKAIIQVGDRRTAAFGAVLGYPAELVPLVNPYGSAGDSLAFRVLVDGRPVASQLVLAGGDVQGRPLPETSARSDSLGTVRFASRAPGRWYVKFVNMRPSTLPGVDYESKWATLTFETR